MPKTKTTSKVSLKLTSRINLEGKTHACQAFDFGHTAHKPPSHKPHSRKELAKIKAWYQKWTMTQTQIRAPLAIEAPAPPKPFNQKTNNKLQQTVTNASDREKGFQSTSSSQTIF